jgi:hypothetical protein
MSDRIAKLLALIEKLEYRMQELIKTVQGPSRESTLKWREIFGN